MHWEERLCFANTPMSSIKTNRIQTKVIYRDNSEKTSSLKLNIHSILWKSRANGPGLRTVVWFQGCSIGCKGCFNPSSHSFEPNQLIEPETLARQIIQQSKETEGITISGGEPFDQAQGLLKLLSIIRNNSESSIVLFTGYEITDLSADDTKHEILKHVDVLIAGAFRLSAPKITNRQHFHGKALHFLTARYSRSDFENIPEMEVTIDNSGKIIVSGMNAFQWLAP